MSGATKIEWADAVWNPVTGCTKVSDGCANCYAERMAWRFYGTPSSQAAWHFQVTEHSNRLNVPHGWARPRRVFVCSMGDLFHKRVSDEFILRVMSTIMLLPRHTFMVLTKRPERMREWSQRAGPAFVESLRILDEDFGSPLQETWPPKNLWLGVSVEDQAAADERIPLLLETPAAVRFVSCEPMLGPVNLESFLSRHPSTEMVSGRVTADMPEWTRIGSTAIDWVICGGESGPGARPMRSDRARSLRDQCVAAGVPFFFKQWGEWLPDSQAAAAVPHGPAILKARFGSLDANGYWRPGQYSAGLGECMYRVGKKTAGRLLDGREWNEFPEGMT